MDKSPTSCTAWNQATWPNLAEPADLTELPQWAKSRTQIDDESVPHGRLDSQAAAQKRMDGHAISLRSKPSDLACGVAGDLAVLLREDGGINPINRQCRYVTKEYSMIKVDVSFKPARRNESVPRGRSMTA